MNNFISHIYLFSSLMKNATKEDFSTILTTAFGVTGGILTLVGLTSIFISLNTQYSVQKCRDLYLRIKGMAFTKDEQKIINFMEDYHLYKYIMEDGIPERFSRKIISLSIFSITFVLTIWGVILIGFFPNIFHTILFFTTFILLIFFIVFLLRLYNTSKYLDLPQPESFLDVLNGKVNTMSIVKRFIEVNGELIGQKYTTEDKGWIVKFYISSPYDFRNLVVMPYGAQVTAIDKSGNEISDGGFIRGRFLELKEPEQINEISFLDDTMYHYEIHHVDLNNGLRYLLDRELTSNFPSKVRYSIRFAILPRLAWNDDENVYPTKFYEENCYFFVCQGTYEWHESIIRSPLKLSEVNTKNDDNMLTWTYYRTQIEDQNIDLDLSEALRSKLKKNKS